MRLNRCDNPAFPVIFVREYKIPELPKVKIKLPEPQLKDDYWRGVVKGLRAYLNQQLKGLSLEEMQANYGDLCREIERIEKFRKGNQLTYTITKKSKI